MKDYVLHKQCICYKPINVNYTLFQIANMLNNFYLYRVKKLLFIYTQKKPQKIKKETNKKKTKKRIDYHYKR
jgi:hypothetical protein